MFKKLFILSLGILLLPSLVFGAISYSRNPSGYTIFSPVSFDISADNFSEFEIVPLGSNYWGIEIDCDNCEEEFYLSDCIASTTLSNIFEVDLPIGIYAEVIVIGWEFETCLTDDFNGGISFEYDPPIFEVVEAPAPTFIHLDIPAEMPGDMLAYAGAFFTDLSSLIVLAGGLPIGFKVIKKIIQIAKP